MSNNKRKSYALRSNDIRRDNQIVYAEHDIDLPGFVVKDQYMDKILILSLFSF